jgi:hypothetical protein
LASISTGDLFRLRYRALKALEAGGLDDAADPAEARAIAELVYERSSQLERLRRRREL